MQKEIDLQELLQENDRTKFENFLKNIESVKILEDDEAEFFKNAPHDWLSDYLDVRYPQASAERVLMVTGSEDLLDKAYRLWGFWEENVLWVFSSATHDVCQKIISCMTYSPGYEAEILMLKRNSRDLLVSWLDKFKSLSEEGERIICEDNSLQQLKNIYIDRMITNPF